MNEELEQKNKENTPFFSDTENQKKKNDEELEQRRKKLKVLKNLKKSGKDIKIWQFQNMLEKASCSLKTYRNIKHDLVEKIFFRWRFK